MQPRPLRLGLLKGLSPRLSSPDRLPSGEQRPSRRPLVLGLAWSIATCVGQIVSRPYDAVRYQPLPRSLDEALDALLEDDAFVDAFDHRLLANLVSGRRSEAEAYRGHVTAWELERYLDES